MQPITPIQLQPGDIISYRLTPKDMPVNPKREWRGKIICAMNGYLLIESTEPGYERLREIIEMAQLVSKETSMSH